MHYDQTNQTVLSLITLEKDCISNRLGAEVLLFVEGFFYQKCGLFILNKYILLSVCHGLNLIKNFLRLYPCYLGQECFC